MKSLAGVMVVFAVLAFVFTAVGCSETTAGQTMEHPVGAAQMTGPQHHAENHASAAEEGSVGGRGVAMNEKCPVMGGETKKDLYVEHEGRKVYFCCPGCIPKFQKSPEQYPVQREI